MKKNLPFFKSLPSLLLMFFIGTASYGQIKLSLRYSLADSRYHVYSTPTVAVNSVPNPYLTDGSSQITIIAPSSANFTVGNVTSVNPVGSWSLSTVARNNGDVSSGAPASTDFFVMTPSGDFNNISYANGVEVELFSFDLGGTCGESLNILSSAGQTAAGSSLNIGSYYSVKGYAGGIGTNHFVSTYNISTSCCPTVTNIVANNTNPTTCSGSNGSIKLCGLTANASGYTVNYDKNSVAATALTNQTADASGCITITGLTAGSYTNIKISNTVCSAGTSALSATLTDPPTPSAPTGLAGVPSSGICIGTSVALSATVTPGATYAWTLSPSGATLASASGSVSGTTASNTFTSTAAGTYTVNLTQTVSGCTSTPASTTITVNATPTTIVPTATSKSNVCPATTVNLTTLQPTAVSGVTYEWHTVASNPTAGTLVSTPTSVTAGTYYLYGKSSSGCYSAASSAVTATLTPDNTVAAASSSPTLCINTALTNITHTTTGATGIGTATGLPAGVTAAWAGNTITISGTPTASGTFTYSIPLTGGCGAVNATGTITVNATPSTVVPTATSKSNVCPATTVDLTTLQPAAVSGVTYEWYTVASNPTAGTLVSTPSSVAAGTYYLYGKSTSGCYSAASSAVTATVTISKPVLTIENITCSGNGYTITFSSNATVTTNNGTVSGNTVTVASGNATLTSTTICGGLTSLVVTAPTCPAPATCTAVPNLSVGNAECTGTGTYTVSFSALNGTVASSVGTVSGNTVINIPVGSNAVLTITPTSSACNGQSITVTSPVSCATPVCTDGSVGISFSTSCNSDATYNINYTTALNGTTVTSSANSFANLTGAVTLTITKPGCSPQTVVVNAPACVVTNKVKLQLKVFLQGAGSLPTSPYTANADGLMRTDITSILPNTEPYTALGFGTVQSNTGSPTFTGTGNNAIVDWVLVELRSSASSSTVLVRKAALLQKDGDIVDMDGVSPLTIDISTDNYYVAVRHRNHFGVMTLNTVPLSFSPLVIDFTQTTTPTYGTNAQVTIGGKNYLWAGNANVNKNVIAQGGNSDRSTVTNAVTSFANNSQGVNTYILPGYYTSDVNMDGKSVAKGLGADNTVILNIILGHPANTTGANVFIIQEQLP